MQYNTNAHDMHAYDFHFYTTYVLLQYSSLIT